MAAPAQAGPRVHNLARAFHPFWKEIRHKSIQVQVARFKTDFAPKFAEYYEHRFNKWKSQGKIVDDELAKELETFPAMAEQFRKRAEQFESEVIQHLPRFQETFVDFNSDIDIYVTHSLGEMDGGTRKINGKTLFIFGIDGIIRYHNAESDTAFFHHELFHVYHDQRMAKISWPDRIWTYLWGEGLATYVSGRLNPGSTLKDMMLEVPERMPAACEKVLPLLREQLLSDLESDSSEAYTKYFELSAPTSIVPKRGGYYLGYLIAKELGDGKTLHELAGLHGDALLEEMKRTIREMH
jgi:hypothetical protein